MGQKVNPIGLRLGISKTWDSCWYANHDYAKCLHRDLAVRTYLNKVLESAGVNRILIEASGEKKIRVTIHVARPGIVIGRRGSDIEKLKKDPEKMTSAEVFLNIVEVRKPEIEAALIAKLVADQLRKRVPYRRAMKKVIGSALKLGVQGIKVMCSGRLGGAEIARTEWYREGRVPLHTLKADIDYALAEAHTTYGVIGVKVWVFKNDTAERPS